MNKQKIKEFVNNHKKELIGGFTVLAVGGAALLGYKYRIRFDTTDALAVYKHKPKFNMGECITLGDMGKFGEKYMEMTGLGPDTIVNAVEVYLTVVNE